MECTEIANTWRTNGYIFLIISVYKLKLLQLLFCFHNLNVVAGRCEQRERSLSKAKQSVDEEKLNANTFVSASEEKGERGLLLYSYRLQRGTRTKTVNVWENNCNTMNVLCTYM